MLEADDEAGQRASIETLRPFGPPRRKRRDKPCSYRSTRSSSGSVAMLMNNSMLQPESYAIAYRAVKPLSDNSSMDSSVGCTTAGPSSTAPKQGNWDYRVSYCSSIPTIPSKLALSPHEVAKKHRQQNCWYPLISSYRVCRGEPKDDANKDPTTTPSVVSPTRRANPVTRANYRSAMTAAHSRKLGAIFLVSMSHHHFPSSLMRGVA